MVVVEGGRILCFVVSLSGWKSFSTTVLLPDMAHTRRPLRSDFYGFTKKSKTNFLRTTVEASNKEFWNKAQSPLLNHKMELASKGLFKNRSESQ